MEKTIIEKLFEHGQEIHNLLCCNDKKTAVKEIMKMYPDISSSENAIASNLTQFKVLYSVFSELKQENEQLNKAVNELAIINKEKETEIEKLTAENLSLSDKVNLLANEINTLKSELENRKSDSRLANENAVLKKEISELKYSVNELAITDKEKKAEIETLSDKVNSLTTEINTLKSEKCLLIKEVNKLKTENEQLQINNADLIRNMNEHKQEELPMMNTQAEVKDEVFKKLFFLESELNSLKTRFNALTQTEIQTIKKLSVKKFHGWNIVADKRGFHRIFKTVNGKTIGLFIGKIFDDDKAMRKITERNLPLD